MKIDVKQLTTEQKVRLVMGTDFWHTYDLDGKIAKVKVSDGPVGVRMPRDSADLNSGDVPSVAYPSTQMLANTWNLTLAHKLGNAIANDCIEKDVDIILGPGVNIKRLPTCGRNFEYFSEDPYLAGVMGREYIAAVQEKHIGTSLKHFCCNNSEFSRLWASMDVDERTLREIYLEAFRISCESKPWTVMCSYNLVNGLRMSENGKLYKVLRNEFGFDGLIVSDWGAVQDVKASVEAGLALEMPYEANHQKQLLELAEQGKVDQNMLDYCAEQVLQLADKCEQARKLRKVDMTLDERRNISLQIAREGIVLLKNNNVLPILQPNASIFVTGSAAWQYYYGGGSSNVVPETPFIPLVDAMRAEGANAEYFESIWQVRDGGYVNPGNIAKAQKFAAKADITVMCVGDPSSMETEGSDRQGIKLVKDEVEAIHHMARIANKLVVCVYAGAAVDMSDWIDEVDAVVWAGYGGQLGNKALSEVLLGKVNPSGRLSETFPLALSDVPAENSYRDGTVMLYEEMFNVGYRYYDTFGKPVLFPFGYGLSYSTFAYDNIETAVRADGVTVSFDVTNTSDVDGATVAQVYVGEVCPKVYRPDKELKGFVKVQLKAGETKRVSLELSHHSFEYYSVALDKWVLNAGLFDISVGVNVSDIVLTARVEIE